MTKTSIANQIDQLLELWRKDEPYGVLSVFSMLQRYIRRQPETGNIDDNSAKLSKFDNLLTELAEDILK